MAMKRRHLATNEGSKNCLASFRNPRKGTPQHDTAVSRCSLAIDFLWWKMNAEKPEKIMVAVI